jgi:DNA polymerase III subunit beta
VKFRAEREVLGEAVSWVARALATRPVVPVLSGILVRADQDSVTLSCFDYEVSARAVFDAEVQEPGAELVPGRLLAEIVKSLPAQPAEVTSSAGMVVLSCGSAEFALVSLPIEDYPSLPELPAVAGTVDGGALAAAIGQVVPAASHDDTLPMLTGVSLDLDGASMTLAATDRYRLAVRTLGWDPVDRQIKASALIPAKTLADVGRTIAPGQPVTIALGADTADTTDAGRPGHAGGIISFTGDGRRLTARLIESDFIRYKHRFPADLECSAELAPAAFIEAVRRVSLVAERATPVQLAFKRDVVVIEARTDGRARGVESVPARLSGAEQVISFNPQYLLDGLAAAAACGHAGSGGAAVGAQEAGAAGGRIRLEFSSQAKPAVITWTAEDEAAVDSDRDVPGNGSAQATVVPSSADQEPRTGRRGDAAAPFRYLVVQQRVPVPG